MNVAAEKRMTVPEYFEWAMRQPQGRFELADGRVVALSPERNRHNLVKLSVSIELREAVARAGLPCIVFTDGVSLVIDEHTTREPDGVVQCSGNVDLDSTTSDDPLIVVEVLSPSSERNDIGRKFVEYFSLPTVRHYLIVDPDRQTAIHHRRGSPGAEIASRIVTDGSIELSPPGMTVALAAFFVGIPPAAQPPKGGTQP